MKRFQKLLGLLLIPALLLSLFPAGAQAVPAPPLSLRIAADKNEYGDAGMAKIQVIAENTSGDELNVKAGFNPDDTALVLSKDPAVLTAEKLKPGEKIELTYFVCLNRDKVRVNLLNSIVLALKIALKRMQGYKPLSIVPFEETGTPDGSLHIGANLQLGRTSVNLLAAAQYSKATNPVPSTKAEILAAYTAVMNKAKTDAPEYKKKEYQAIPEDKRDIQKGKTLISVMLNLAGFFMKEEDKAEVETQNKGSDMKWFPVYKALPDKVKSPGCLLTNTDAIKSAKCDPLANGNYKITIVLNDEMNPEPYKEGQLKATSNHGNMFSPLARSEIEDTLKNDSKVNWAVKDPNFDLKYYDCTAELTYDPETNQIITLNQYVNVKINIKEPTKVTGMSVVGSAVLVNTLKIKDVKY